MATKREEINGAVNEIANRFDVPGGPRRLSCLAKAGLDEPLFILRAQDKLATEAVRNWCAMLIRRHMEGAPGDLPSEKITEALKLAQEMERWQAINHDRAKWPD